MTIMTTFDGDAVNGDILEAYGDNYMVVEVQFTDYPHPTPVLYHYASGEPIGLLQEIFDLHRQLDGRTITDAHATRICLLRASKREDGIALLNRLDTAEVINKIESDTNDNNETLH